MSGGTRVYLKGIYKKTIYNRDNYTVGLLKVKDNDIDPSLNDKTITFTGYFSSLNLDDNLKLNGNFTVHNKYGDQFTASSYEVLLPEEKDGIITFLSSDLFTGIGEAKGQKIYNYFQSKTIEIITNEPQRLKEIKGITLKNINTLHDKLMEYGDSIETIVKLNEYGFNNKDSTSLYNKYKKNTFSIIEKNIYDIIDEEFTYKKIDLLALRHDYERFDKRRIKASIIYVMGEVVNTIGDTYILLINLYDYLIRALKQEISFPLYEECIEELLKEEKIIVEENKYFLPKIYYAEKNLAKRFVYLNNYREDKVKNLEKLFAKMEESQDIKYNDKQKQAIMSAFQAHFMIITGGPGTGKTTIIKSIVDLYQEIHKKDSRNIEEMISLLAPTGRAAKRMMESVHYPASTIHRFLKWNKDNNTFGVNEYNKAKKDLVIIDEASMVDVQLMDSLLKGLYYDTKIILVGDFNQLPSVGPGEILKDIILSKKFLTIELDHLYRQKENSNIITLAYDINNGLYHPDIFNINDDLTYIKCDSYNLIEKFNEICYAYKDMDLNEIEILAPMYKTINGIDNLNLIAREIFNPKDQQKEILIGDTTYRENDKITLLLNMPDDNIYNGDVGIILEIDNQTKEIYVDFDGNIVKFTKNNFYNFRLGYVTSIHKSQGSEFKIVIIILLNEYRRMLYRKLFYTGVTRAKEKLFLLGEEEAIQKAIENNTLHHRKTVLQERILKMYEDTSINLSN